MEGRAVKRKDTYRQSECCHSEQSLIRVTERTVHDFYSFHAFSSLELLYSLPGGDCSCSARYVIPGFIFVFYSLSRKLLKMVIISC
jgi:hypothetical protein